MSIINTNIIISNIIANNVIQSGIINAVDGIQVLKPNIGWIGDTGCISPSITEVTVGFSKEVTYTNHTGVTITHDNGGTFTITGPTADTTKYIIYEGTWDINPVFGDIVSYSYSSGNYIDEESVPMEDVTLVLTNCFNVPPTLIGTFNPPDGEVGVIYGPYDTSVLFSGVE